MKGEEDLMQKLMVSKKMMDIHNNIPRSGNQGGMSPQGSGMSTPPMVESQQPLNAKYNIPDNLDLNEGIESQPQMSQPQMSQPQDITEEKIMGSNLPDDIKRLMIENPIDKPDIGGPTLSNDLVEKASRLMNSKKQPVLEESNNQQSNTQLPSNFREMLKEVISEVLTEKGMITETTSKSNEKFVFKVGKHLFEGKILKVKKSK